MLIMQDKEDVSASPSPTPAKKVKTQPLVKVTSTVPFAKTVNKPSAPIAGKQLVQPLVKPALARPTVKRGGGLQLAKKVDNDTEAKKPEPKAAKRVATKPTKVEAKKVESQKNGSSVKKEDAEDADDVQEQGQEDVDMDAAASEEKVSCTALPV